MPFVLRCNRLRAPRREGRGSSSSAGRALATAASIALIGCSFAAPAHAVRHPQQVSELVLDAKSGDALFARAATVARPPASLTKMMTLFLVFDALDAGVLRSNDTITVSRHAANQQPSRLGLRPGQRLPLKTAIRAVAVDSANDVAVALAERLAGSEGAFAQRMTRKARELGLRHTSFANATGLTNKGNRTTAQDIAALSLALLRRHPDRYGLFKTRSIRWANRTLPNHNHLIGHVPGVDGIKTGFTADAGYNLAASAQRKGRRVIVVVLGEHSASARDVRVSNLLERGFIARPRDAAS